MNPVSVDIGDIIATAKLGTLGVDLFIGKEPASPTDCVTIYDTGGGEQDAKLAIDESTIQMRARNRDYLKGNAKLTAIKKFLEGKKPIKINNTQYVGFWTSSNIAFIQYDKSYRAIWTVNFRVIREPDVNNKGNRE